MTDEEVSEWLAAAREHYGREAFPVRYSIFFKEDFMASKTSADRRSRQRDALKGQLRGLTANSDAVKHLAEEVREAAHTDPAAHRRVIEIFERLGVLWPAGFKP